MGKLILVRHGRSLWNEKNLFTGWTDVDLAPEGIKEAKKAGQLIKEEGLVIDICFSSYLKRAIKTAWLILETSDMMQVDCFHSWKLNERHYGAWQGENKEAIQAEMSEESFLQIRRGYTKKPPLLTPDDQRHPKFDKKYKHVDPSLLPLGESLEDTEKRVVNYFFEVIAPFLVKDCVVLVSAHGNSLRALIEHIENIPSSKIAELEIPTGVPYIYEFDNELNLLRHHQLN